jgi:hypothetical protein
VIDLSSDEYDWGRSIARDENEKAVNATPTERNDFKNRFSRLRSFFELYKRVDRYFELATVATVDWRALFNKVNDWHSVQHNSTIK